MSDSKRPTACICCIACQENDYIREWVSYNHDLGFSHIYLYDNNKSWEADERFGDVISDFIESGFVTVIDRRDVVAEAFQADCYNHCYATYGAEWDWMLFTDCDEFMTFVDFDNVGDFLALPRFGNYQIIKVNWLSYNDNGNIYRTDGNVQDRFPVPFDRTKPEIVWENRLLKSFVRCGLDRSKISMGIHSPVAMVGGKPCAANISRADYRAEKDAMEKSLDWEYRACLADGSEVMDNVYPNCFSPFEPKFGDAYIRHYRTKSCEEYVDVKARRGFQDCSKQILNSGTYFYFNEYSDAKMEYFMSRGLEKPVFLIDCDTSDVGMMMCLYAAAKHAMSGSPHGYDLYWKNNEFLKVSEVTRNAHLFDDVTFFPQTVLNDIKYMKNCGEYHYVENIAPYNRYVYSEVRIEPGRNIRMRGERLSWMYFTQEEISGLFRKDELLAEVEMMYGGVDFMNTAAVYVCGRTAVDDLCKLFMLYTDNVKYVLLYDDYEECAAKVSAAYEMMMAETGKQIQFIWLNRADDILSGDVMMMYTIARCRVNFVDFSNACVWMGAMMNRNELADIIFSHRDDEVYGLLCPAGDVRFKRLQDLKIEGNETV